VPEDEYGWLRRGMIATMQDDEVELAAHVCLIEDVQTDDSGMLGLVLLLLEDPVGGLLAAG
jgi:hypothetical protein